MVIDYVGMLAKLDTPEIAKALHATRFKKRFEQAKRLYQTRKRKQAFVSRVSKAPTAPAMK